MRKRQHLLRLSARLRHQQRILAVAQRESRDVPQNRSSTLKGPADIAPGTEHALRK